MEGIVQGSWARSNARRRLGPEDGHGAAGSCAELVMQLLESTFTEGTDVRLVVVCVSRNNDQGRHQTQSVEGGYRASPSFPLVCEKEHVHINLVKVRRERSAHEFREIVVLEGQFEHRKVRTIHARSRAER